jgi:hypothetical protein
MTKRNLTLLAAGALALAAASVENASAAVYFSDDFEGKTNPLDPPDIGIGYTAASATGNPFSISTPPAPAIGTGALKVIRESRVPPPNDNPGNLVVQGNEGALVDGAVVEFSWNNQIENTHSLNGPIQIGLGFVSGGATRAAAGRTGRTTTSTSSARWSWPPTSPPAR